MKEEALKLADKLEEKWNPARTGLHDECIRMIRKLVAELDKQGEPVAWIDKATLDLMKKLNQPKGFVYKDKQEPNCVIPLYTAPQTKPLSEKKIGRAHV